jgi:hypothetical protein
MREEEQENPLSLTLPISFINPSKPRARMLYGLLPDGRRLAKPLKVVIEYDEEEVVVSEPYFHIHASAPTEEEAIKAFRRVFAGYLDFLSAQENSLGTELYKQLQYLRSYITSV